jgi:hypothetical protein
MAPLLTSSVASAAVNITWSAVILGSLVAVVALIIILVLCLGHGNSKEKSGGNGKQNFHFA